MANDNQDVLSLSVRDFIEATGAKVPTPGGGSIAGVVGALAGALGQMALRFTQGKKKFAEHEEFYARLDARLDKYRKMFEQLVQDDMAAFTLYQQSSRMPEGPEREQALSVAIAAAIDVPREMAKTSLALMEDLESMVGRCSKLLISDLVAAGALASAVVRLTDYNVRVNIPHLEDRMSAAEVRLASTEDVRRAARLLEMLELAVASTMP